MMSLMSLFQECEWKVEKTVLSTVILGPDQVDHNPRGWIICLDIKKGTNE